MLVGSSARRPLLLALACVPLFAVSGCSKFGRTPTPTPAELRRLYDNHDWFKLNTAVERGNVAPFFRAAMECVLNKTDACEREMAAVIQADRGSDFEYEAYSQLTALYLRQGKYRHALEQIEAMLRLRPNDADARNVGVLLKAASAAPEQQVAHPGPAHVPWVAPGKSLTIPASIDGHRVKYFFDTGANFSIISDADAKRLNLTVRSENVAVNNSTGQQAQFHVATAGHLQMGDFDVENVAFLVFPQGQPPFDDLAPFEQGMLGISPLLAAKRFSWSPLSGVDLGAAQKETAHLPPNMVFDGQDIVALADFQKAPVVFLVDSGSDWSFMYPRFAKNHAAYVNAHGRKSKHKSMGFGGEVNADVMHLPELSFTIADVTDRIPNVDVLLQYTDEYSKRFDGTLGADTMRGPHSFSLDFDAMRLTIH